MRQNLVGGAGSRFSETDLAKIANSQISIIAKKGAGWNILQISFAMVLFDALYHNYHVWMKIVLQF